MEESIIKNKEICVLIVDDHPVIRLGLRGLLNEDSAITVVGDAGCTEEVHTILAETRPDVILLDPGSGDMQCVESLRRACPETMTCRIILYTAHDDKEHIMQATVQKVNGYLLKDCSTDELLNAIHAVYEGGTVLSPAIATKLMQVFNQDAQQEATATRLLSSRELEVLDCLAEGRSNRSIAEKLFICEATVKFHVHAILGKLHVTNRTEAVLAAVQQGFINLSLRSQYVSGTANLSS
jgi:DNA-binding NarL/FixJ family response regulator